MGHRSGFVRSALGIIALSCLPSVVLGQACELDADCGPGSVCRKEHRTKASQPGVCRPDPRAPRSTLVVPGVVAPRSDRDPSSRTPTTLQDPIGYLQCASDRDCPDGTTCTRRDTSEKWHCRKR